MSRKFKRAQEKKAQTQRSAQSSTDKKLSSKPHNPQLTQSYTLPNVNSGEPGFVDSTTHQNDAAAKDQQVISLLKQAIEIESEDPEKAEDIYLQILSISPRQVEALYKLALIAIQKNNLEDAKKYIMESGKYWRKLITEIYKLGNKLNDNGLYGDAEKYFRVAADLLKGYEIEDMAYVGLGFSIAHQENREEEAEQYFKHAVGIKPDNPYPWYELAAISLKAGMFEEGIGYMRKSLSFDGVYYAQGHSDLLLTMLYCPDIGAGKFAAEAQKWADIYAPADLIMPPPESLDLNPDRKLRLGFVSTDFKDHPVTYFIIKILKHLSKADFEVFCYSNSIHDEERHEAYRKQLKQLVTGWVETKEMTDQEVAEKIRKDQIDILIDLSGHTAHNRLIIFAYKPALIQASWIGFLGTTGMSQIDYYICDDYLMYPGIENHFTEKLLPLKDRVATANYPDTRFDITSAPALQNQYVTFGCYNNSMKINSEVVELWSEIMKKTPDSRLRLKFLYYEKQYIRERYLKMFAEFGIEPERIEMEGHSTRDDYYKAFGNIDIALDPFPYNGGTSTLDSIWMGVPVITLAGNSMISRGGVTILSGAGLQEFIAESKEEYAQKAVDLSSDVEKLNQIRLGLRKRIKDSVMFDEKKIAENFEEAMRKIWINYVNEKNEQKT